MHDRAYGALGRIGIVTPQANPTAEAEIGLLLPARVSMVVARCVSRGEPRQPLHDYFRDLPHTLARFDVAVSTSLRPHTADTRSTYALAAADAAAGIREALAGTRADAYLMTGTGMPSLALLAELTGGVEGAVLNSNLCLAWHCLGRAGIAPNEHAARAALPLLGGWVDGLDRL